MGEMKTIVIEGYPVEKLPEDVRRQLDASLPVKLTVEQAAVSATTRQLSLTDLYGAHKGLYASQGLDPVDFVRSLRDEWER
jgi:hypothetical protein